MGSKNGKMLLEELKTENKKLQKQVELQATELELEAALERVRARSIGMDKSEELQDAAAVLFQQIEALGVPAFASGFNIWDDERKAATAWMAGKDRIQPPFKTSSSEDIFFRIREAAERGELLFVEEQEGEALKAHYAYMNSIPTFKVIADKMANEGQSFPTFQIMHCAFFSHGYLMFISFEPVPNDHDIFKRFAKVFEQTYTRFLDLQKAEEHAREAEIQLALERVRAGSMAMHKSEELADLSLELVQQVQALGIDTWFCAFNIYDDHPEGSMEWGSNGQGTFPKYRTPREDIFLRYYEAGQRGETLLINEIGEDECPDHYDYLCSLPGVGDQLLKMKDEGISFPTSQIDHVAFFKYGYIIFITFEAVPKAHTIFKRFAKVFEQTYTRFLDLQKAEEQAREAQIEASLERVRVKGMAMHSTKDIESATAVVFNELSRLGIDMERCGIVLMNESPIAELWSTTLSQGSKEVIDIITGYLDFRIHPLLQETYKGWREKKGFSSYTLIGDEVRKYYEKLEKQPNYKFPKVDNYTDQQVIQTFNFNEGGIFVFTKSELSAKAKNIVHRFTKVFEQTYTRFLDLQKAEENAREAQIEASLERVRARSMAMQNSDELNDVLSVLFRQFDVLGIQPVTAFLSLFDIEKNTFTYRSTSKAGNRMQTQQVIDLNSLEIWKDLSEKWKNDKQDSIEIIFYPPEIIEELFGLLDETFSAMPEKERLTSSDFPKGGYAVHGYCKFGYLGYNHHRPPTDEEKEILIKFAKEFGRVYQRFLDIQKAEEQAREAEIEAALERVRAVSMAMHESDELVEVATTVYQQLIGLGFGSVVSGGFNFPDAENNVTKCWFAETTDENLLQDFRIPFEGDPVLNERHEYRQKGEPFLEQVLKKEDVEKHMEFVFPNEESSDEELAAREAMPDPTIFSIQFLNEGYMILISVAPLSEEQKSIMGRFAGVFNSAYTRFLDLQKAEEQAREAQIEAALERIRSISMAMQSSTELNEVVRVMYDEVEKLDISNWGCALMIFDDTNKNIQMWFSELVINQHVRPYNFDNQNHELVRKWWKFWESEDEFLSIHLTDEEHDEWVNYLFEDTGMKNLPEEVKEVIRNGTEVYFEYAKMKQGLVSFINLEPFPKETYPILKRIARTFEQAYTRFLDVLKAEKLALETARQSSLDRIRAEIASMRSADDLQQITPLIWDELKTLDIPFIRCGVFIIDEENGLSHTYLSTPQGESIAAMHLPLEGIAQTENIYASWKKQEIYTEHWDKEGFKEWTQDLIDRGIIDSKEKYKAGSAPETLDLHFLPFKHGMLYIGNTEPLSQESLDLGQSMTDAFSVAYDRYEDFNKLEIAKQKIEEAFRELEAAQDQLVQQEKLASLGQLTAGIAHEIKNPLNFVTNFSDLSVELIEETNVELQSLSKGLSKTDQEKVEEALMMLKNIENNLNKIHEHGTRADGIVKSMLEHSKGGSGTMEPTDLNGLIKEFVNLSFHGMRAGKYPINVDIDLQLDESVGQVPLIAEDFSRVIVNLCNNAFDAMREKLTADSKQLSENPDESYEPKLTIITFKKDSKIIIEIQDNGPGIPDDIKDKILQPFFTTKKGTEGTGLGLSITHDIVKAHGGEMTVNSGKKKGTTFSVIVPLKKID